MHFSRRLHECFNHPHVSRCSPLYSSSSDWFSWIHISKTHLSAISGPLEFIDSRSSSALCLPLIMQRYETITTIYMVVCVLLFRILSLFPFDLASWRICSRQPDTRPLLFCFSATWLSKRWRRAKYSMPWMQCQVCREHRLRSVPLLLFPLEQSHFWQGGGAGEEKGPGPFVLVSLYWFTWIKPRT